MYVARPNAVPELSVAAAGRNQTDCQGGARGWNRGALRDSDGTGFENGSTGIDQSPPRAAPLQYWYPPPALQACEATHPQRTVPGGPHHSRKSGDGRARHRQARSTYKG